MSVFTLWKSPSIVKYVHRNSQRRKIWRNISVFTLNRSCFNEEYVFRNFQGRIIGSNIRLSTIKKRHSNANFQGNALWGEMNRSTIMRSYSNVVLCVYIDNYLWNNVSQIISLQNHHLLTTMRKTRCFSMMGRRG